MANNMRTTLLQAGTAEGLPLTKKAHYIAPDITTVEFAVEIGTAFSNNKVNSWGSDWTALSSDSEGTEAYEMSESQGTGFFN